MATRCEIRRKLENGDLLCVAECDDRRNADKLGQLLNEMWPGEYEVLEVVEDGSP
jgi:hypothetical protein